MSHAPNDFAASLPHKREFIADGKCVFSAGQRVSRLFFVEAGTVRLLRVLPDAASATMHTATAGEWIAESSLYSERYHCDAVADGTSVVSSVSKRAVLELFEAEPQRCLQFSRLLAMRLRELRSMHEIVRMKKAEDRVLHWLRLNAEGDPPVIPLRKSWSRIAEDLALTRESLYRTVAVLKREGRVVVTNASVRVIAPFE
jgi:CRP-like cAMP-binding protein